jgi:alkylation response protein AidB-like acyl-CoA dehydrogenase
MNLDLTQEQQILKTAAREFLEREFPKTLVRKMEDDPIGHSPHVWKKMADLGWIGFVIPEKYGGAGFGFQDLVVLLEEMGRACLVGPFFSTAVLCTLPILDAGNEEQKQKFLPKIAKGELIMALALTEPSASYNPAYIKARATAKKDGYVINGTKLFIHDAHIAHYLLCVNRTSTTSSPENGITLFLVDTKSPGITVIPLSTMADDKQNEVAFDKVAVPKKNLLGELDKGWSVVKRLLERAQIAKCAEMVGGADWTVEASVAYAKERVQYGRPIGSFQVIQHYLADMWIEAGMAKRLTYYAAWAVENGLPCAKEVAAAKAWVNDVYRHVTRMGVQVHGAIGTTRDHDMGLYYRRAKQAAVLFGDSDFCRELVAKEVGI